MAVHVCQNSSFSTGTGRMGAVMVAILVRLVLTLWQLYEWHRFQSIINNLELKSQGEEGQNQAPHSDNTNADMLSGDCHHTQKYPPNEAVRPTEVHQEK
jgi:hypothetical protein